MERKETILRRIARRRRLLQIAGYDYSSVQYNLPQQLANKILNWSKENITDDMLYEDSKDDSYGREDKIHVTVKYGLHTNDAKEVKDLLSDIESFDIELGKMSIFKADKYDVLKIDVDSSDLHSLNKLISDNLKVTDTHPTYKPHITIAYLKKEQAKKFIDDDTFNGERVTVDKVMFSAKDDKKQTISLKKALRYIRFCKRYSLLFEKGFIKKAFIRKGNDCPFGLSIPEACLKVGPTVLKMKEGKPNVLINTGKPCIFKDEINVKDKWVNCVYKDRTNLPFSPQIGSPEYPRMWAGFFDSISGIDSAFYIGNTDSNSSFHTYTPFSGFTGSGYPL